MSQDLDFLFDDDRPRRAIRQTQNRVQAIERANEVDIIDAVDEMRRTPSKPIDPAATSASVARSAPEGRTWGEALKDTGLAAVQGVIAAPESVANLAGLVTGSPDNAFSRQAREAREVLEANKSAGYRARQQALQRNVDAAEGIVGKAGAALTGTLTDPALLVDALGQSLPATVAAGGVGAIARGAGAAAGLSGRAAGAVGVGGAVGAGAAMQGSDIGAEAYNELKQLDPKLWEANQQFRELVASGVRPSEAQDQISLSLARRAGTAAGAISLFAQMLPGARSVERALLGNLLEKRGKLAATGYIAKGTLGEMGSEGLEEGGGKLSGNVALATVDPDQDITEGVGQAAGQGAAVGAVMGGGASLASVRGRPVVDDTPPAPADPVAPADPAAQPAEPTQPASVDRDQRLADRLQSAPAVDLGGNRVDEQGQLATDEATDGAQGEQLINEPGVPGSPGDPPVEPTDRQPGVANNATVQVAPQVEQTDAQRDAEQDVAPTQPLPDPSTYDGIENIGQDEQTKRLEEIRLGIRQKLGLPEDADLNIRTATQETASDPVRWELSNRVANTLKKLFDIDVVLADFGTARGPGGETVLTSTDNKPVGLAPLGLYAQGRRTVLIDAASPKLLDTAIHEPIHFIEENYPDLYKSLADTVRQYSTKSDKLKAGMDVGLAPGRELDSEFVAMSLAEAGENSPLWTELFRRAGEVGQAQTFKDKVVEVLDAFMKAIQGDFRYVKEYNQLRAYRRAVNDAFTKAQIRTAQERLAKGPQRPQNGLQGAAAAQTAPSTTQPVEAPVGDATPVDNTEEQPTDPEPLYEYIKERVLDGRTRPSTEGIQKAHRIGYGKALTTIRRLEQEGVVSPAGERGARTVNKDNRDKRSPEPIPEPTYDEEVNEEPGLKFSSQAGEVQLSRVPRSSVFAQANKVFADQVMRGLGLSPGANKARKIGEALNRFTLENYGQIPDTDNSVEARNAIAAALASEVRHQLNSNAKAGDAGLGWYSHNYPRALKKLSRVYPELKRPDARALFTAIVAVTSNGEKVKENIKNARKIYDIVRDGGRASDASVGVRRADALENNLGAIDVLLDRFGPAGMAKHLMAEMTVAEINKELRARGEKADSSYTADTVMPRAALYFGPKLGAFYANLMGSEGYLTMDLWWSRTFNRIRGTLIPQPTETGIARVKALLANEGIQTSTDDEVVDAAVPFQESYKKRGYKGGTELEVAANTVVKAALLEMNEAPFRASDRTFMYGAATKAQELLRDDGITLSLADIQAALWYYEKRLYSTLGKRGGADDIGYEEALNDAAESDRPRGPAARFDRVAGRRTQPKGAGREATGSLPAQEGRGVPGGLRSGGDGGAGVAAGAPAVQLSRGDGRGLDQSRGDSQGAGTQDGQRQYGPLPGYAHGSVQGSGPDPEVVRVAEQFARDNGIPLRRQAEYVQVDPERAARIAAAYEAMPHAPQDPAVREAYQNLIRQTRAQYDALVSAGYQFTFFDSSSDPYSGNPWNAMRDLRANKRMAVYGTYDGYGTEGVTQGAVDDNPMLEETGLRWPDQKGEMRPVLANDLFRAVHDAFGHGMEGAGFRAQGEENAWQAHARLFTGSAVAAITSETRGQNSWLNYGPYGEQNKNAKVEDTVFADQKTGLMPEWTWTEGRAGDFGVQLSRARQYEAQDAGTAPVFRDRPAQPGSAEFVGYHYSAVPRAQLSGTSYGSATSANRGKEYERVMQSKDRRLRDRIYFYTAPMAEVPRSEPVVTGAQIHKVVLTNIWDPRSADDRPRAGGAFSESALIDAGYDGYVSHEAGMIVALNTKPIPVQHIGNRQGLAEQIQPNPVLSGAMRIEYPKGSVLTRDGMLARRPENNEVLNRQQRAAVEQAAPSFGMEYGEYKVRPEEKDAANQAAANAGASFQFSRAGYTGKRIDDVVDTYAYMDDRTKAVVAWVRPADFLAATSSTDTEQRIRDEAGELREDALRNQTQPIFLRVNDGFRIDGHEGRHRMAALDRAGVQQVPVVIYKRDAERADFAETLPAELKPQLNDGNTGRSSLRIESPVSVKYGNVGRIRETFGAPADVQFSRQLVDAWQEIAKDDDVFRYRKSDKKDFIEMAGELLPDVRWEDLGGTGFNKWQAKIGEYEKDGRTAESLINVTRRGREVWIDVSEMVSGKMEGAAVYNLAANYAFNNGLKFIGDPGGLSPEAAWRRLSNMASSALKFGTTDHLQPHPNQFDPARAYDDPDLKGDSAARKHLRPLDWIDGDTRYNLDQMLRVESESILSATPEIRDVRYDFEAGQYVDPQGDVVSPDAFSRAARAATSRGTPTGSTTLQRAVLTQSALQGLQGRGLGEDGAELLPAGTSGLARILYSRPIRYQGNRFTIAERTLAERASNQLLNEMSRVRDVQQQIASQGGAFDRTLDVDNENRRQIRLAGNKIERFRQEKVDPLMKRVAKLGFELGDIDLLMYARFAPQRNKYIAGINSRFPDGGSGMKDAEAKQAIAALQAKHGAKYPQLLQLAKDFQALTNDTRSVLRQSGLVDPQVLQAWQTGNPDYVPLKGFYLVDDDARETSNADPRWDFSKRALGRHSKAGQIVQNILKDHERAVSMAAVNETRKTLLDFVQQNADDKLWEVDRVVMTQQFRKTLPQSPLGYAQGIVQHIAKINESKQNTVAVRVGGNLAYITVKDPGMLDDLNRLSVVGLPGDVQKFLNGFAKINKALGFLYTALSPAFVLTNAARDLTYGTIRTARNYGAAAGVRAPLRAIAAVPSIYKALYTGNWDSTKGTKYERYFNEFREVGGAMGIVSQLSVDHQSERLERSIARYQGAIKDDPKTWHRPALSAAATMVDFIVGVNTGIEQAIRVASYAEARESGKSQQEAADIAANVTVDFARRGKFAPVMSAFYLFYNPAVQGAANTVDLITGGKGWKGAAVGTAGVIAPLMALGFYVAAMSSMAVGDDDEPYWDSPANESTKLKNLIFFKPDGSQVRVPLPYGIGLFVNLGYAMHDIAQGKPASQAATFMLKSLATHFSPLGNPENPISFVSPTAIDPVMVLSSEKREDGAPLMPTDYTGNTPDSERYFAKTRGTLVQEFTEWLNRQTGGNESRAGAVSVSPESINYLINFATGGLGTFVRDLVQTLDLTISDEFGTAQEKNLIPILKSVYRTADNRTYAATFYENMKQIEAAAKEAREQADSDDPATQERLWKNSGIASMERSLRATKRQLAALRKEDIAIVDSDMTRAEKEAARKIIDEQRKDLFVEMNRAYKLYSED
jgi:hypothetical protein